ncbi:MAG: hypothetical protein V3T84_10070 [Phycisphaerales bacterium]
MIDDHYLDAETGPDTDTLLLVVVGAHLRAELTDRPLAYMLVERIEAWQRRHVEADWLAPLVCSDLWYLNAAELLSRPTICLGRPGVNAASAFFANRLPTAFVLEETFQVQLDLEFITMQACVWGVNAAATASGVELFEDRYLDPFLRAAHGMPTQPA